MKNKKFLERRKYPRLKEKAMVAVVYNKKDEGLQIKYATVSGDISKGGIGIYLADDIPLGSPINIDFCFFSDPVPIPLKGKVQWLKEVENVSIDKTSFSKNEKMYWVGIEFVDIDLPAQRRILRWLKKRFSVKLEENSDSEREKE